jgi:hypothetical protein
MTLPQKPSRVFPRRLQLAAARVGALFPTPTPRARTLRRIAGVGAGLTAAGAIPLAIGLFTGDPDLTGISALADTVITAPTIVTLRMYAREVYGPQQPARPRRDYPSLRD